VAPRVLVPLACALALLLIPQSSEAAFPGLPGQIAFSREDQLGVPQVWVVDPGTSRETALTEAGEIPPASQNLQPSFTRSGLKIAFISDRDGNGEIYVMGSDGSDETRITETMADETLPAWTASQARIVFTALGQSPLTGEDLFRIGDDGTGLTTLVSGPADERRAELSADGDWMAFESEPTPGDAEIFSADANGGSPRELTTDPSDDRAPSISPDNRLIAFQSDRDGDEEIYLMNTDGSQVRQLTFDPGADTSPAFSPDGTRIAFISTRGDPAPVLSALGNVYVMAVDGGGQTRVTGNSTAQMATGIDWQPIPVKCAARNATQVGTAGPDLLVGTPRKDVIAGLGDRDVIQGMKGGDRLCGGKGRDLISGAAGRDKLIGGGGRDRLRGGPAQDRCAGGRGRDKARGCELRFKV
jgi:Tol biopolymer transport system component